MRIIGSGEPSSNTPGILGQEYIDKSTGVAYRCVNVKHITGSRSGEADARYEWVANGGGVTSWNDFADKPFGEEVCEGVIFGETEFDFTGQPSRLIPKKLEFIAGE